MAARAIARKAQRWMQAIGGNAAVRIFTFATGIVLARVLGPTGRGLLTVALLWPSVVTSVGAIVNTQTSMYFSARFGARGYARCIRLARLNGLALLPVAVLINWLALRRHYAGIFAAADLYCVTIPLTLVFGVYAGALLSRGRIGGYWAVRALASVGPLLAVLALAATHRLTVNSYVVGAVAGLALGTAVAAHLASRRRPERISEGGATPRRRDIGSYGVKIVATSLPAQANFRLDQLLMSVLVAPEVIGEYVVATTWSSLVSVIGTALGSVVQSDSAQLDGNDPVAVSAVLRNMRRSFACLIAVAIVAMAAAGIGLPLVFGRRYSPAFAPAVLLCVSGLFANAKLIIRDMGRGLGHPSLPLAPETAGVIVRVPCLLILLPFFGGTGAAVASLVSTAVSLGALCVRAERLLPNVSMKDFVPRVSDFSDLGLFGANAKSAVAVAPGSD